MPDWDTARYLRFERERTLPCSDLVHRIDLESPQRVVDLGCGPGNSTAVLARRWAGATLIGVDQSPEMLRIARGSGVRARWIGADLREWTPDEPLDLVFSNAALQWLPDHPQAIPRLWAWVKPGGALGFQVPARPDPAPAWVRALEAVVGQERWRGYAEPDAADSNVLSLGEYYELLAGSAQRVDLWDVEHDHVLDGPAAIVEWTQSTALRPTLARMPSEADRSAFLDEYAAEIRRRYRTFPNGTVLFPFLRRFVVAYR
jgi:trans-aconitate 2-methyltransferase